MSKRMLPVEQYKKLLFDQIYDYSIKALKYASDDVLHAIDKFKNFVEGKHFWTSLPKRDGIYYVPNDQFFILTFETLKDYLELRDKKNDKFFKSLPDIINEFIKLEDRKVYTYLNYTSSYHGMIQEAYYDISYFSDGENKYPLEFFLRDRFGKTIESYATPTFIFATPDEAKAVGFIYAAAKRLQIEVDGAMQKMDSKEANKNGNKNDID